MYLLWSHLVPVGKIQNKNKLFDKFGIFLSLWRISISWVLIYEEFNGFCGFFSLFMLWHDCWKLFDQHQKLFHSNYYKIDQMRKIYESMFLSHCTIISRVWEKQRKIHAGHMKYTMTWRDIGTLDLHNSSLLALFGYPGDR